MTINMEQIEELRGTLAELPEAPPRASTRLTKKRVVASLYDELQEGMRKGYTLKALAEILDKNGLRIHPGMLGQYLRAVRNERSSESTQGTNKGSTERRATKRASTKQVRKSPAQQPGKERSKGQGSRAQELPQRGNEGTQRTTVKRAVERATSGNHGVSTKPSEQTRGTAASSGGFDTRKDSDDI